MIANASAVFEIRARLAALRREYAQQSRWADNYAAWGEHHSARVARAHAEATGKRIDALVRELAALGQKP